MDLIDEWPFLVGAVFFIALAIGLTIWASRENEKDCNARGGVIHCTTGGGTVIVNGKVGYGTTTTCECYWPDGRLLIR